MKKVILLIFSLLLLFKGENAMAESKLENTLYLDLKDGRVVIEMEPKFAPNHVKRIKELVRKGFYDGVVFHRVIDGFMAQTGDPTGTGMGGSGKKIKAEFNTLAHTRGAVSMARAMDPDSADSQFFIVFDDATFLDNQYTVWGYVVEGMEYVDNIKKGNSAQNGTVEGKPDKIKKIVVASDVKKSSKAKPKKSKSKKATAKKTSAKKTVKKSSAKKSTTKKAVKKAPTKKVAKKSAVKKSTAKKVVKKSTAKKTTKKSKAKKSTTKKSKSKKA